MATPEVIISDDAGQPTSLGYIWHGVLYAVTSAAALGCGSLFGNHPYDFAKLSVLGAFFAAYFPFFIAYTAVFARSETHTPQEPRATFYLAIFFGVIGAYAISLQYRLDTGHFLPALLTVSLAILAALYWIYGWYLLHRYNKPVTPLARHQLVWSVVLAVGITLYAGISFESLDGSLKPLLPLILVVSTVFCSEVFHIGRFSILWVTSAHLLVALIIFGAVATLRPDIARLFGCIAVSAYLATFEAWSVTSTKAQRTGVVTLGQESLVGRYYNATLLALTISGALMPLVYLFTSLSPWFLLFMGLHTLTAFGIWFLGRNCQRLLTWPWKTLKIVFGILFLAALAVDSKLFSSVQLIAVPLPRSTLMYTLLTLLSAPVLVYVPGVLKDLRDRKLEGLFSSSARFLGIAFYLSAIGVGISIIIYTSGYSHDLTARATYTCSLYLTFWILSGVYIGYHFFSTPPMQRGPISGLVGILSITRVLTSLLIGGAIIGTAVSIGMSLTDAVLKGLPFVMAAMGGFALNDVCDVEQDRVNKPYRPIPRGSLSKRSALILAVSLLAISTVAAVFVASSYLECGIFLLAMCGAATYNMGIRYVPVLKNLWTGALCVLPLCWIGLWRGIDPWVVAAALCYIVGRELLMDVVDLPGDEKTGRRTIPCWIGVSLSSYLAFALLSLGTIVFCNAVGMSVLSVPILLAVPLAMFLWWRRGPSGRRLSTYMLWLPMLMGSLSL